MDRRSGELARRRIAAGALVAASWSVLLAGHGAARWIGPEPAIAGAFALNVALAWSLRPEAGMRLRPSVSRSREALACVLAGGAGFAGLPFCVAVVQALGLALGLAPRSLATPPVADFSLGWAPLLLAPFFEEPIYRERLLGALRWGRGGRVAVLATSLVSALPHVLPWSLLGTFVVGLGLGGAAVRWRSLAVCVALHLGLNIAVGTGGMPPRFGVSPGWSALLAGAALLGVELALRGFGHAAPAREAPA